MGLFSKNKKQTKESGYVSFTEEDLRAGAQSNEANAEAYELLDAAMTTSSHITEKDKEGNTVDVDDIYPCSLEECDEMDALLDKAEEAAQDKRDEFFRERLAELREIVDWSRKKHWTFKWPLIFGCIVSIFLLNWCHSDAEDDLKRATRDYEMVDNWAEQDTTVAWNNCERGSFGIEYKSANAYKLTKLQSLKRRYEDVATTIDGLKGRQTYAENQHAKDSLQKVIDGHVESQKKFRADYDAINQMKGDLMLRIQLEYHAAPARAYYDFNTLAKLFPSEKKNMQAFEAKFKANKEIGALGKVFEKIMLWGREDYVCKNAGEAKKNVQELQKFKKVLENLANSQNAQLQGEAMLFQSQIDTLIDIMPTKVPQK